MSGLPDGKPTLKTVQGGRSQIERDIVRALAVGDDAGALAGMARLEKRGALQALRTGSEPSATAEP